MLIMNSFILSSSFQQTNVDLHQTIRHTVIQVKHIGGLFKSYWCALILNSFVRTINFYNENKLDGKNSQIISFKERNFKLTKCLMS